MFQRSLGTASVVINRRLTLPSAVRARCFTPSTIFRTEVPIRRPSMAVLIDGENVNSDIFEELMQDIERRGNVLLVRIYGRWRPETDISILLKYNVQAQQQYIGYKPGRGAADVALAVDAMDLLHANRYSAFCLVTGDGDFRPLVSRLRQQGSSVHGYGWKASASPQFQAICDTYTALDFLDPSPELRMSHNIGEPDAINDYSAAIGPDLDWPKVARGTCEVYHDEGREYIGVLTGTTPTKTESVVLPVLEHTSVSPALNTQMIDQETLNAIRLTLARLAVSETRFRRVKDIVGALQKHYPTIKVAAYGFRRYMDLLAASGLVRIGMIQIPEIGIVQIVRLREKLPPTSSIDQISPNLEVHDAHPAIDDGDPIAEIPSLSKPTGPRPALAEDNFVSEPEEPQSTPQPLVQPPPSPERALSSLEQPLSNVERPESVSRDDQNASTQTTPPVESKSLRQTKTSSRKTRRRRRKKGGMSGGQALKLAQEEVRAQKEVRVRWTMSRKGSPSSHS